MQRVVSVSGGKDSTAVYILAIELGRDFTAVFADTGNESPITLEYIDTLPKRTGGPPIRTVKASFHEHLRTKRSRVRAYKRLSAVERAFRCLKTVDLKVMTWLPS